MDLRAPTLATILTVSDALLTYAWLHIGIAEEGNPLLLPLIHTWGAGPAMVTRALIGLALVAALTMLRPHTSWATWGLRGVNVVLGCILVWHLVGPTL